MQLQFPQTEERKTKEKSIHTEVISAVPDFLQNVLCKLQYRVHSRSTKK